MQDIGFLQDCLRGGDPGRCHWNRSRSGGAIFESISTPLTQRLANNVEVVMDPPKLWLADLRGANLSGYDLSGANLSGAHLDGTIMQSCKLEGAHFIAASLRGADLSGAILSRANLLDADLTGANLTGADLVGALLLRTICRDATFDRCLVHGISVWGTVGEPKRQKDLVITTIGEPLITVDDIEVGQFVYLMLQNQKIRNIVETLTSKVVLILGRFTDERKSVLDCLRDELRHYNLSPVLFDFDPASGRDITDTVTLLARMARFVIADLTDPMCVQQELTLIAPEVLVPIQPIILAGHRPWAMYDGLVRRSRGLLPIHEYQDVKQLVMNLSSQVIGPAELCRTRLGSSGSFAGNA